jgi:hypothetical protein
MFNNSRLLLKWFRSYNESRIRNILLIENICDSLAVQLGISNKNDNLVPANWRSGASNFNVKSILQEFLKASSVYKTIKNNFRTTICIVDQSRFKTINFESMKKYVFPLNLDDFYRNGSNSGEEENNWIVYFHPMLTASEINDKDN